MDRSIKGIITGVTSSVIIAAIGITGPILVMAGIIHAWLKKGIKQ